MRTGISITITRSVRGRLEAITRDRNASQKHAWRAAIILSSADGVGTNEIMRRTGKSKTCVWRWQERFMKEGIDGLLHDKTRPSRIPPLGPEVAARVVALTLADPPVETTHWTADLMARASGISASAVRRIWKAHGLQPHHYRQFKLSTELRRQAARFVFHFTPTSCSWLNAAEGFFARLSRRRLKRGVFRSVVDLQAAINRFLAETNAEPKPFTWTADPDKIIAAVRRGHQALDSIH
jgi:transposase